MLDCILSFKSFMKFSVNFCGIRNGLKVSALYLHPLHSTYTEKNDSSQTDQHLVILSSKTYVFEDKLTLH